VKIYGVYPNYPAQLAGLQHDDVITFINDIEIKDQRHYREFIAQSRPGQTLEIKGYSKGEAFTKQVQTVERPAQLK